MFLQVFGDKPNVKMSHFQDHPFILGVDSLKW